MQKSCAKKRGTTNDSSFNIMLVKLLSLSCRATKIHWW